MFLFQLPAGKKTWTGVDTSDPEINTWNMPFHGVPKHLPPFPPTSAMHYQQPLRYPFRFSQPSFRWRVAHSQPSFRQVPRAEAFGWSLLGSPLRLGHQGRRSHTTAPDKKDLLALHGQIFFWLEWLVGISTPPQNLRWNAKKNNHGFQQESPLWGVYFQVRKPSTLTLAFLAWSEKMLVDPYVGFIIPICWYT